MMAAATSRHSPCQSSTLYVLSAAHDGACHPVIISWVSCGIVSMNAYWDYAIHQDCSKNPWSNIYCWNKNLSIMFKLMIHCKYNLLYWGLTAYASPWTAKHTSFLTTTGCEKQSSLQPWHTSYNRWAHYGALSSNIRLHFWNFSCLLFMERFLAFLRNVAMWTAGHKLVKILNRLRSQKILCSHEYTSAHHFMPSIEQIFNA